MLGFLYLNKLSPNIYLSLHLYHSLKLRNLVPAPQKRTFFGREIWGTGRHKACQAGVEPGFPELNAAWTETCEWESCSLPGEPRPTPLQQEETRSRTLRAPQQRQGRAAKRSWSLVLFLYPERQLWPVGQAQDSRSGRTGFKALLCNILVTKSRVSPPG